MKSKKIKISLIIALLLGVLVIVLPSDEKANSPPTAENYEGIKLFSSSPYSANLEFRETGKTTYCQIDRGSLIETKVVSAGSSNQTDKVQEEQLFCVEGTYKYGPYIAHPNCDFFVIGVDSDNTLYPARECLKSTTGYSVSQVNLQKDTPPLYFTVYERGNSPDCSGSSGRGSPIVLTQLVYDMRYPFYFGVKEGTEFCLDISPYAHYDRREGYFLGPIKIPYSSERSDCVFNIAAKDELFTVTYNDACVSKEAVKFVSHKTEDVFIELHAQKTLSNTCENNLGAVLSTFELYAGETRHAIEFEQETFCVSIQNDTETHILFDKQTNNCIQVNEDDSLTTCA